MTKECRSGLHRLIITPLLMMSVVVRTKADPKRDSWPGRQACRIGNSDRHFYGFGIDSLDREFPLRHTSDGPSYVSDCAAAAGVRGAVCLLPPARRATHVDPMIAFALRVKNAPSGRWPVALSKKFGKRSELIETVEGYGYQFRPPA